MSRSWKGEAEILRWNEESVSIYLKKNRRRSCGYWMGERMGDKAVEKRRRGENMLARLSEKKVLLYIIIFRFALF